MQRDHWALHVHYAFPIGATGHEGRQRGIGGVDGALKLAFTEGWETVTPPQRESL